MEIAKIIDEYQSLKKKTQEILGKEYEVKDISTIYIYAMDTYFFIQTIKGADAVNVYLSVDINYIGIKTNIKGFKLSQETKKELIDLFTNKK